jgi:predicted ATPase
MMFIAQRTGENPTVQRLATEILQLCAEFQYPDYALSAQLSMGWLTAKTASAASGVAQIEKALAGMAQMNMHFKWPYFLYLLAQAQRKAGHNETALQTVERALVDTETSGDVHWRAELLRMNGDLHLDIGHAAHHVESLYEAALTVAREQHAKMLELRATVSLARLWQTQGKCSQAYACLEEIYNWFTEGHQTADLQIAHKLLSELA